MRVCACARVFVIVCVCATLRLAERLAELTCRAKAIADKRNISVSGSGDGRLSGSGSQDGSWGLGGCHSGRCAESRSGRCGVRLSGLTGNIHCSFIHCMIPLLLLLLVFCFVLILICLLVLGSFGCLID